MLENLLARFAATCADPPGFFGFPAWYQYLPGKQDVGGRCDIVAFRISDFPYIGLALVDIAFRIMALVAVGYVIYGGVQFVIAQGESDKTKRARQTIINALIGLVIALFAAGMVAFIGRRFD